MEQLVNILIAIPGNKGFETYLSPLVTEGYKVSIVPTGMDAIIRMNQDDYDCLLMELNLPDLTGVEVCRIVRTEVKHSDIPILIMTYSENDDWEKAEEAFDAGAFDFIRLPSHPVELKARISTMVQIKKLQDKLKLHALELSKLANFDYLTGLYNRRAFDDKLSEEMVRAKRYSIDLSIFMIDIDHFKQVNDRYGHNVGDIVLKRIAETFKKRCREVDIVGRFGGEEFVIMLPHTNLEQSTSLAEDLRASIEIIDFSDNGINHPITISLGICSLKPGQLATKDQLLKAADIALYRAKNSGRNRIESEEIKLTDICQL